MAERTFIPAVSSEFLENQDATDYSTTVINAVLRKREIAENRYFVTQRPGFTKVDPTATTGEAVMRASWLASDFKQFHVTQTKLWLNLFGTEITPNASASAITSGHDKMYMDELNNDLVIIDPENNEGKWMDGLGATEYYNMDTPPGASNNNGDFTYFPPNQSKTLAHGIAILDRTMYVLTNLGEIWGSDLNDASNWTDPLNFIRAERNEDTKYYITRHHDHIVVFGGNSIEFFFDAANPVGSPLARRADLYYNIGLLDPRSVWQKEDIIYFVGRSTSQAVGVYKMQNFEITKISTESIDYILGDNYVAGSAGNLIGFTYGLGSGVSWNGEDYYVITPYYIDTDILPQTTVVYNSRSNVWTKWTYPDAENDTFPCINSYAALNRNVMFLTDGTYLSHNVVDPTEFFVDTYNSSAQNIPVTVKLLPWDNGNHDWKFISQLRCIGEETSAAAAVTVKWIDHDTGGAATGTRTIDLQDLKNKLTRLGRTKRRSFELTASISSQLIFEGLELLFDAGSH